MSFFKKIKYNYCRYPFLRIFTWVFILVAAVVLVAIVGHNVQKKPVIAAINPSVGAPGDIMIIDGENFGNTRGTSYVEMGDTKITASGYVSWADNQIKIVIPSNAQNGLLFVGTSAGRSVPEFFTNEAGIPVVMKQQTTTSVPVIDSISPRRAAIGQLVKIKGSNFGKFRLDSQVFFTANVDVPSNGAYGIAVNDNGQTNSDFIPAADWNYDYEYWSDTEIHVRVPDGAATGKFFVQTEKGDSAPKDFTLTTAAGKKNYTAKRTYIIQLSADISNTVTSSEGTVLLNVPRPTISSFQPTVELTECFPEPLAKDKKTIIHQKQLSQLTTRKQRFTQNFVITNYTITTNVKNYNILPFNSANHPGFEQYLQADALVPSDDKLVHDLKDDILGNSTNPYLQAKLIYNYFLNHYKIVEETRTGNISVLDLPREKSGDAYDFAVLYTAVCRASGIPAIPVSGILIEDNTVSRNHWWVEIYFENFGWFPVDVALGAGMKHKPFVSVKDYKTYYFGNLDSQHIVFSRGWNDVKSMFVTSKKIYRPRSYAFQSIWEETTSGIDSYSSLWNDPVILGIY